MSGGYLEQENRMIRVLVGEDSPFMRRLIADSLSSDPGIEVVGVAENGREVLKKVVELDPDCITLDLEMPHMDGLETLRYLMSEWPTPVVILSGHTATGARLAITCLEFGAVDFIAKTLKGTRFPEEELRAKVRMAASVDVAKVRFHPSEFDLKPKQKAKVGKYTDCVVLIGASTGGPQALMEIVPKLPPNLEAGIVIVQHMPPNFTRYLAERLDARTEMVVSEAEEGSMILPGTILVAPGGMHLFLEEKKRRPVTMLLPRNELQKSVCPSLDFAMTSFSTVFKEKLVGVVLTGMGRDGTAGASAIKRNNGKIICQDEATAMIYGMPGSVTESGHADEVIPLDDVADRIVENVNEIMNKEPMHESQ